MSDMKDNVHYIQAGPRGSAIMGRVGGYDYPQTHDQQCKTCNSRYRVAIENALLKSYGYASIISSLPDTAGLTTRNIREHARNHMPMEEIARRVLIEQDAEERGLDIEGYRSTLANHVTFAKLGVQKVLEDMMMGNIKPDISDGIAFANLLMKVEEKAGDDFDTHSLTQGFIVYMEAMVAICTPEQVQAITDRITTHPVMRGLLKRSSTVQGEIDEPVSIES